MYSLFRVWKRIVVFLLISVPVYTGLAFAGNEPAPEPVPEPMALHQIVAIVTEQGFGDIRSIAFEADDNEYELDARDSRGRKVEIEVNALTGKITDIDKD